jgi:hypothetical protein
LTAYASVPGTSHSSRPEAFDGPAAAFALPAVPSAASAVSAVSAVSAASAVSLVSVVSVVSVPNSYRDNARRSCGTVVIGASSPIDASCEAGAYRATTAA